MKKFTCLFIIMTLLCLFMPESQVANANYSKSYARVINDTTPFFSDTTSNNLLFYLPYTYYVKIIGEKDNFYHVEYGGYSSNPVIDGFVPKTALFFDELSVSSPYPNVDVVSSSSCTLYENSKMDTPIKHIFANRKVLPYGINYAPNGSVIYFVSYNDSLGYLYESQITPFTINNHENPLTFLESENVSQNTPTATPNTEQDSTDKNFLSLRIVIIVCLVFAGLIALFVGVKNASRKRTDYSSYYEENDYE